MAASPSDHPRDAPAGANKGRESYAKASKEDLSEVAAIQKDTRAYLAAQARERLTQGDLDDDLSKLVLVWHDLASELRQTVTKVVEMNLSEGCSDSDLLALINAWPILPCEITRSLSAIAKEYSSLQEAWDRLRRHVQEQEQDLQ